LFLVRQEHFFGLFGSVAFQEEVDGFLGVLVAPDLMMRKLSAINRCSPWMYGI
jgi:hypothetical protein